MVEEPDGRVNFSLTVPVQGPFDANIGFLRRAHGSEACLGATLLFHENLLWADLASARSPRYAPVGRLILALVELLLWCNARYC